MTAFTIGRLLRGVRTDPARGLWDRPGLRAPETITVRSASFEDGGTLDPRHRGSGAGANTSPALHWTGAPPAAAQLVLIIEDIDVPLPRPLVHTAAVLPPTVTQLPEGGLDSLEGVRFVRAAFGRTGYHGPRPLRGHGPHRYRFELFALDRAIPEEVADVPGLCAAADGHVMARGILTGVDERPAR